MSKIQKITIIKYTEYKCTLYKQVERVQNKILFQQYVAKKSSKDATNPKGCQRELWHGFSVDALDSICKYGFNRGYCWKNGKIY